MSRSVSAALEAHLWQDCTTLTTLWRLKRQDDSLAIGFTEHDVDIDYDDGAGSVTYRSTEGYIPSTAEASVGGNVDNLDVQAFFSSDDLTDDDLQRGLWDNASITLYLVNWRDLTQGHVLLFHGRIGEVANESESYTAEMRSLALYLQRRLGRTYASDCDAERVGDDRCQFVFGVGTTASGTVGTVGTDHEYDRFTAPIGAADHVYTYGIIHWDSGENAGRENSIQSQVGDLFFLTSPTPRQIQIGDAFTIYAGCDRTFATCASKFANAVNYQGFPHVPGRDTVFSVAS